MEGNLSIIKGIYLIRISGMDWNGMPHVGDPDPSALILSKTDFMSRLR